MKKMRNRCKPLPLHATRVLSKALVTVALLLAVLYVPLRAQDETEEDTANVREKEATRYTRTYVYEQPTGPDDAGDEEACENVCIADVSETAMADARAAIEAAKEEMEIALREAETTSRENLAIADEALREVAAGLGDIELSFGSLRVQSNEDITEQDTTRKRRKRDAEEDQREADEARQQALREREEGRRERSEQMKETIRESMRDAQESMKEGIKEGMRAAEEATRAVNEAMRSLYEEMGTSGYSREGDMRGRVLVLPAPRATPAPRAIPSPRAPYSRREPPDASTPPTPPPAAVYGYSYSYDNGNNNSSRSRQGDEVNKRFVKEFKLGAGEKLELRNKYGMVNVTTWPQNEIKVDVQIKVYGYSSTRAQEILDQISIQEQRAEGKYSFITTLGNNMSNWGRGGFEINYDVSLPASTPLLVTNAYGNVYMGSVNGPLDIIVKYGKLNADEIKSENANISLHYSAGNIESLQNCSLLLKYSKCNLESCKDLKLTNDYSKLNVTKVGLMNLVSKYGDIEIDNIRELDGIADYSSFDIGRLDKVLRLQAKYITSFNLDNIPAGFELIELRSKFSTFNLNFAADANFNFDTNFRYGDLRYPKETTKMILVEKDDYGNSSKYEGSCGTASKKPGQLTVTSDYGDVRISRRLPR